MTRAYCFFALLLFSSCEKDEFWSLHIVEQRKSYEMKIDLVVPKLPNKTRKRDSELYFQKTLDIEPPERILFTYPMLFKFQIDYQNGLAFGILDSSDSISAKPVELLNQVNLNINYYSNNFKKYESLPRSSTDKITILFKNYNELCFYMLDNGTPCLPQFLDVAYREESLSKIKQLFTDSFAKAILPKIKAYLPLEDEGHYLEIPNDQIKPSIKCSIDGKKYEEYTSVNFQQSRVEVRPLDAINCKIIHFAIKLPKIKSKAPRDTFKHYNNVSFGDEDK